MVKGSLVRLTALTCLQLSDRGLADAREQGLALRANARIAREFLCRWNFLAIRSFQIDRG